MNIAQEFLASLVLDEDTHAHLQTALADALDLDEVELRDFLGPFLAADAVDRMVQILSITAAASTSSANAHQEVSTDVSKLELQADKFVEESVQVATLKKRTSIARRACRAKTSQLSTKDTIDEDSFSVSGSSDRDVVETAVLKARSVKAGHYVMINNRPCRVEKIGTSKVWKGPESGCFKSHFVARCIFTGKKFEHLCLATADVSIAVVQKLECQVMDIGDDGELSLLTSTFDTKADVNLPAETDDDRKLAERIKAEFHKGRTVVVQVMSSCGHEKVVEILQHKCTD